jgi:hypothetical protein
LIRNPYPQTKVEVGKILTSVNDAVKLPAEFNNVFRWLLMSLVNLLQEAKDGQKDVPSDEPGLDYQLSRLQQVFFDIGQTVFMIIQCSKSLQKVASDIGLVELVTFQIKNLPLSELKTGETSPQLLHLVQTSLEVIAELTSSHNDIRNKLAENHQALLSKIIDCLNSKHKGIQLSGILCLKSLTRSD